MSAETAVAAAVPADACCSLHPDRPAVAACARCGAFVCGEDRQSVGGSQYCPTCAARPDVDYLEAFRQKYWGKRDGWAWLMGFGSVLSAVWGVALIAGGYMNKNAMALAQGVGLLPLAVVLGSYFFGLRWARWAIFVAIVLQAAVNPREITPSLVGVGLLAAAYFNTRNRLFFRVEVTREALQKAWGNNTLARTGFFLGLASLLFGFFAPFGLVLSIIGLTRVNPKAHPPIGGKGQAIAGIVLSSVGMALLGVEIVRMMLE